MQVHISVIRIASSLLFPCSAKGSNYDTCVQSATLKQLNNKCIPVFMEINEKVGNQRVCQNFNESQEALKIFQSISNTCIPSCAQVHVGIIKHPVNRLYIYVNGRPGDLNHQAYYFFIPQGIPVTEFRESYSIISFVADVGGWMGLLIGISVVGSWTFLLGIWNIRDQIKTRSLKVLLLLGWIMISIIIVQCCFKLAAKDTGSDINIESVYPNLSLSICSLENVYVPGFYNNKYIAEDTKFYQKIRKVKIWFKDGEIKTIFDNDLNLTSDVIKESINIPTDGTFIETCHTVDLNYNNPIDRIEITARRELVCYCPYFRTAFASRFTPRI